MRPRIDDLALTLYFAVSDLAAGNDSDETIAIWPDWRPNTRMAWTLLFPNRSGAKSGELLGHDLSAGANLVLLRLHDRAHSLPALMWAADQANELGGRPDRLMVAGCGVSGACAARVAMNARDRGWPVLYRQVLVHPRFTITCPAPQRVVGAAPATIVSASGPRDHARRYAARLKRSGVEVCELREPYSWRGQTVFERRLIADLAHSLQ